MVTSRTAILAAWAVIALLLVGCQVLAWATRHRFTSLQGLLDRLTHGKARFIAVFLGWMWVGWHLFAR